MNTDYPQNTSHFKNWLFDRPTLSQLRENVYNDGINYVKNSLEGTDIDFNSLAIPSIDEVFNLISYYIFQIIFVCNEKHFDYSVTNTATSFLTRFFLKRDVFQHDPRVVLLTCIFLALKLEESAHSCSLQHFCDGLIQTKKKLLEVVENEIVVLEALSYQIRVLHPRLPIHYITTQYYHFQNDSTNSDDKLSQLVSDINVKAEKLALDCYCSIDIPLLFSPALIGLVSFMIESEGILTNVNEFVSSDIINRKNFYEKIDSDKLRAVIQELRVNLTIFRAKQKNDDPNYMAEQSFKTLRKIEKIKKLIKKNKKKYNSRPQQSYNVSYKNNQ